MEHIEKSKFSLLSGTLEILVAFLAFALVNINSLVRFRQFPEVDNFSDNEGGFILAACLAVAGMVALLVRNRALSLLLNAWRNNMELILFLSYCFVSVLWSVYPAATGYKLIFLFFAAFAGSYFAVRYGISGILKALSWVGGFCAVLSIITIIYFPFVGVMQNQIFYGSWTGIFWHRNHTGNIFAFFNMIFLLRLLWDSSGRLGRIAVFASFYLLTAVLVFGSHSATGVIVFLFLNFVVSLVSLWLRVQHRLKPIHYYGVGGLLVTGFLIFVTNTTFFFGVLGRSANMTGRIPLWEDLLQRVYMQHPILGHGYGALWMLKRFRIEMQITHNWPYQVYFADNGFIDILLNTGFIGLILFLAIYLLLGYRSLRQVVVARSWCYFAPFITFLYILVGNLTYSFMLEVDQFVWMLLVIMLFLTNSPRSTSIPQPYNQPKSMKLNSDR